MQGGNVEGGQYMFERGFLLMDRGNYVETIDASCCEMSIAKIIFLGSVFGFGGFQTRLR